MKQKNGYAVLLVHLAPEGKEIRMTCDNAETKGSEDWQENYANCIDIDRRFYCGVHAIRPIMNAFQVYALICGIKGIALRSIGSVVGLFHLARHMTVGLHQETAAELTEAGKVAELFIWYKSERTLSHFKDGVLKVLQPGNYAVGIPDFLKMNINRALYYEELFFARMRRKLNATTKWQLKEYAEMRPQFYWREYGNWDLQTTGFGKEISDDVADALAPYICEALDAFE